MMHTLFLFCFLFFSSYPFFPLYQLALYVLSFLGPRDLLKAAQTCRYWRILAEDNLLWREKCKEEGIDEEMVYGSRMRRRHMSRSPCKALFMRQSQIEHNWRKGVNRPPKVCGYILTKLPDFSYSLDFCYSRENLGYPKKHLNNFLFFLEIVFI